MMFDIVEYLCNAFVTTVKHISPGTFNKTNQLLIIFTFILCIFYVPKGKYD